MAVSFRRRYRELRLCLLILCTHRGRHGGSLTRTAPALPVGLRNVNFSEPPARAAQGVQGPTQLANPVLLLLSKTIKAICEV